MHKCMDRWVDPLRGKTETPLGPYSCGRRSGHVGPHAHAGHGAHALWDAERGLIMSIQTVDLSGPALDALGADYPEAIELEGSTDADL